MKKLPFIFIKSAVHAADYPPSKLPEVAIVGRSNAGKSSLINCLAQTKVAKVSGTPGKTRLLNFFKKGESYVLVDMPGYGFAARGNEEVGQWQRMIEGYLTRRETLVGLILVMDIRRNWSEEEELLKRFVFNQGRPMSVALMKSDKLSRSEVQKAVSRIQKQGGLEFVFPVSALKKVGYEELEEFFFREWIHEDGNLK